MSKTVPQRRSMPALRLAVCAFELPTDPAGTEVQLFPAGEFRARDGRPANLPAWRIDADVAQAVLAAAATRRTPYVVDYEHHTLTAKDRGHKAIASGWFKALEWREGSGLWATGVSWTPAATKHLADQEYKYISPVFSYDAQGNVVEVLMAALTNFPGIDGMEEVLAAATTHFIHSTQENAMDLIQQIRAALGVAADADDAATLAALTALQDKAAELATATTRVAELTTQLAGAKPDPAKYVPIAVATALREQVAALSTQVQVDEVEQLVDDAIEDARLMPAERDWAVDLGKSNIASLRTHLEGRTPIAALASTQTGGKQLPTTTAAAPSPELVAVAAQFGLDPATLK